MSFNHQVDEKKMEFIEHFFSFIKAKLEEELVISSDPFTNMVNGKEIIDKAFKHIVEAREYASEHIQKVV